MAVRVLVVMGGDPKSAWARVNRVIRASSPERSGMYPKYCTVMAPVGEAVLDSWAAMIFCMTLASQGWRHIGW